MLAVDDALLISMYEGGMNDYDVAHKCHIGRNTLRRWRQVHGVPSKTNKKGLSLSDASEMAEALQNGLTLTDVGKDYGVSRVAVVRILKKAGILYREYRPRHPAWASSYRLSEIQRQMVIGDLFGDGHLAPTSKGSAYYTCVHSMKQVEFVKWKHAVMSPLSSFFREGTTYQKMYCRHYHYASMGTWTNRELGGLRDLFYPSGEKALRPELVALLTPLSLAAWYMGDGSVNKRTGVFHAGLKVDLPPVAEALSSKFGMEFRACRYVKEWHLRVMDAEGFFRLVAPHIIPMFSYKVPTWLRTR